ncbi:helix-turn-helix domain-containing protein [Cohnella lubricantis]|uniref:Transposase n=1 Tax=Cohnella lubricantis TaxID=2163172 RepID=A0A841T4Y1_9BACL|nr:helix-turn-helix domain-containing protein [Cohnella lubricantis]MBB6676384.1 transposase [Cohnella lubricantis]MBP2117609.1 transposase-like protein [Cohnella lubricantis]
MSIKEHTASEKYAIIQEIEHGCIGVKAAINKFGISKSTIAKWRRRYRVYGYEGLEVRTHNRSYSAELKLQAVNQFQVNKYTDGLRSMELVARTLCGTAEGVRRRQINRKRVRPSYNCKKN